jgi:hypothetical protein
MPQYVKQDERWGFLYQIDHKDASTGVKFTRVMHCKEPPGDEIKQDDENCNTVVVSVINKDKRKKSHIDIFFAEKHTDLLNDGRDLVAFDIESKARYGKFAHIFSMVTIKARYTNQFRLNWTWPADSVK